MADFQQQFVDLVQSNPQQSDLAEAVILLAAIENPGVEIRHCHAQLDRLVDCARSAIAATDNTHARAAKLCEFLREQEQFKGNRLDYYAPSNSHIDKVLERRSGIPISLAFIYMHIGEGLGWPMAGIGFPGHFLVSVRGTASALLDPFEGVPLSEYECIDLLRRVQGDAATLRAEYLRPLSNKSMLQRMLRNLKQNYLQQASWDDALRILNLLLAVEPAALRIRYERAMALERLECFAAAAKDLRAIASVLPKDSHPALLAEKIQQMDRKSVRSLH